MTVGLDVQSQCQSFHFEARSQKPEARSQSPAAKSTDMRRENLRDESSQRATRLPVPETQPTFDAY